MACSLKQTCVIEDILSVRKYLFPARGETGEQQIEDNDDNDWNEDDWADNWENDQEDANTAAKDENDSSDDQENNWFHKCQLAFSPTYDLLVIGHGEKIILLTAKSEGHSSRGHRKYKIASQLEISEEPGEHITSILCIPLVSLKKTSHGSVDWSCIVAGFSSGYIRMYTENGALLISQLLHESPVMEIKCRTHDQHSSRTGVSIPDQPDEVTILYGDALVLLEGFSLFQTLRACRSQVALAAASGGMTIEPPPMSYKKWRLTSHQSPISSHISPGVLMPDPFDQMKTASILGGYSADIRSTAPAMSCFIAAGSSPFAGFYYAVEGSTQPHLSHVALAVASKLKSALYSSASRWLAWGTGAQPEPTQKQKPKVELGTPLDIRCGMPDPIRHGDNIILAPGSHLSSSALAATTDSLGRVILMDVSRAIALRMWKGYRDAQIGFIRVFDDAHRSHRHQHHSHADADRSTIRRHALFLLIYAPRRGLLEVWTCINGPRVGAFNVSKNAKLICPGHGMMGLNSSTISSTVSHTFQCCLLEASGQVREIKIPFHLALSDANSKKARDMHLLKKLNLILHSKKRTGEEAVKILLEIRISGMLRQALEKLLHTRKIGADTFRSCITAIQQRLKEGGALKKADSDLLKYCEEQINLIDLYEALQKLNQAGLSGETTERIAIEDVSNVDTMCELLHMTRTESTEALHSISCFCTSQHSPRVTFEAQEKPILDVAEFLDCFSFQDNLSRKVDDTLEPHVELRRTERTKTAKLAAFLFHSSLFGSTSPDDVLFTLNGSIDIKPQILLELLFQHWLIQDSSIINGLQNCLQKLYNFIESCSKKNPNVSTSKSESMDSFLNSDSHSSGDLLNIWEWIREDICASSHNPTAAYFLAIVARGVAIAANTQGDKEEKEESDDGDDWEKMQKQEVDEDSTTDPPSYQESCAEENSKPRSGDWETLWIDVEKWNLFIHQLEDCVLINTSINLGILTKRRVSESKAESKDDKPEDKTLEQENENVNKMVSVKDLLSNGPGYMAELVSHSICELNIPPRLLQKMSDVDNLPTSDLNDGQKAFFEFLHRTLYNKFPYSLAPDCLHSHCFWELMMDWNKEPLELSKLITAIEHLKFVQEDPHARHGLAVMSWRTFVTKRYAALAKLMEKVGKAPKDRLCRKEVGISDILMPSFCQACTDILQIIADAELDTIPKQIASETSGISTGAEDPWQNVTGKRSIMDMGRAHAHANRGLVQHNMHLSFIMHATMQFQLRGVKPLTGLFDRRGKSCFGLDLTTHDPTLPNPDMIEPQMNKARQHFLTKVVSAAVQQLASHVYKKEEITSPLRLHMTDQECKLELEKWIETAVHMASEFQISSEKVKMHHVDELFKNGLDAIGLEASVTVSDKEVLASSLVLIVGQRLSYILLHANPDDGVIMMSRMSTTLSTWIKSQDSTLLKKPDVDISDTLKLSRTVLTMMSESNSLYNMALSLEEAASTMAGKLK